MSESGVNRVCPCSEVSVRPCEPSFWFQVACSQLAAFVWLKHSEVLGFLKKQCHCTRFKKNHLFCGDYIIYHWWNAFILMRSSRTDGTILCNQHMNGIWMPVLFSHPQHRDDTRVRTQTVIPFYVVCGEEKGLSVLNSITHKITILNAVLRSDLNMLYDHSHYYVCSVYCNSKCLFIMLWLSKIFPLIVWDHATLQTRLHIQLLAKSLSLCSWIQKYVRQKSPPWPQSLTFHLYILVSVNMSSVVLRCWIDPERLKILIWLCGG